MTTNYQPYWFHTRKQLLAPSDQLDVVRDNFTEMMHESLESFIDGAEQGQNVFAAFFDIIYNDKMFPISINNVKYFGPDSVAFVPGYDNVCLISAFLQNARILPYIKLEHVLDTFLNRVNIVDSNMIGDFNQCLHLAKSNNPNLFLSVLGRFKELLMDMTYYYYPNQDTNYGVNSLLTHEYVSVLSLLFNVPIALHISSIPYVTETITINGKKVDIWKDRRDEWKSSLFRPKHPSIDDTIHIVFSSNHYNPWLPHNIQPAFVRPGYYY